MKNKPDERDLFAGAILNYAKKYGLEASKTMDLLNRLEIIKPISTRPAG